MHETERKTFSSRKILTLHKFPFQKSKAATKFTRLTKFHKRRLKIDKLYPDEVRFDDQAEPIERWDGVEEVLI